MKSTITATILALCLGTAAYAQTSMGMPAQEKDSNAVGGASADRAQMKTDAKKDGMNDSSTMGASGQSMGMMKGIDTNGDGMISKEEWDAHHAKMWDKMNKNGSISMRDLEMTMGKGGPQ